MVNILGANSVSGGYEIDNSLRFNSGDNPKISKTPDASNRKTWTFSTWIKRSTFGTNQRMLGITDSGNDFRLRFRGDDKIAFLDATITSELITNRVFRDPSAWYHIMAVMDTTQGTASNRAKLYVNGVLETSIVDNSGNAGGAYPSQNADGLINSNVLHTVGCRNNSGTTDQSIGGYMAETHFIDGVAKAPTDFGETDDNGVWIPKKYTGSYGTNGFYLEFKETGTDADASGMGADTSGNDNHFAPTNLAATDVTTDTPTNNFATANPLYGHGEADLKEGNCLLDAGGDITAPSTIGFSSGKWYMEMKSTITAGHGNRKVVGIYSSDDPLNNPRAADGASDGNYPFTGVIVNLRTGVAITSDIDGNATDVGAFANNDICSLAYDGDNGLLYIYKNGSILNSGNALNAGNALDTSKTYLFYLNQDGGSSNNGELFLNFGNPSFAISSGNADANGYGNFEYAVPSGFYSLCTKNLGEFG